MDSVGDTLGALDGGAWIALAALAVSIFTLWRQHRAGGRAHFTAEWEDERSLVFVNHGPGAAVDVRAELQGGDGRSDPVEVPYLAALQTMRMILARERAWGAAPSGSLRVGWNDSRWKAQQVDIVLPEPPRRPASLPGARVGAGDIEKAIRAVASDEARKELNQQARRGRRNSR
ncbi:hypothetical protein ACLM5J_03630 [Nocardioides sp. Bht2]|uniref:hypothetical protein n=1 Tax=Nocardioides sp. Bht2 TaxID=3392297 RepID=UPI0039B658A2